MRWRTTAVLACLVLVGAACTSDDGSTATGPPAPTASGTEPAPEGLVVPMALLRFGTLPDIPLITSGRYPGPPTPSSLDGVDMSEVVAAVLEAPGARAGLESDGFVVVPSEGEYPYRQFFQLYADLSYSESTFYLTTDAAYHHWHLVFDKVLRTIEQDVFLPRLETLVAGLLDNATGQADELRSTSVGDDAARVRALFQVTATLLGLPTGTLDPTASRELELIELHAELTDSPILGTEVDYSLYTPRGHYTRTAELTRYFLAMSLLGQTPFAVDPADPERLRPGVLAARALLPQGIGSAELLRLWEDLYGPTAFLVGTADDYTPVELAEVVAEQVPGGFEDPEALTDETLSGVAAALLARRPVRIDPEHPSLRLMGTRFVLDSWILDRLLYPNVGTEAEPRIVASAVDVASAFGSPLAERIERDTGQFEFEGFGSTLERMRVAVEERPLEGWAGTVYDAWLWALEPMWATYGKAFPDYMRSEAWAAKALQTGLSSYAELKHDTILYTKQAAGEGGGPMRTYEPRHWVEPDPVAFARLAAVATLMRDGLAHRELLTDEAEGMLTDLIELETFFAGVAADELAGTPISEADNRRLEHIGYEFEGLWWRTSDQGRVGEGSLDDDSAIVADIARAGTDVVEVGTGRIDRLLVIVPDDHGGFQVATGAVYSYYEFLQPLSGRLNDEAWRQMLAEGEAPDRPAWEQAFLAS